MDGDVMARTLVAQATAVLLQLLATLAMSSSKCKVSKEKQGEFLARYECVWHSWWGTQ